MVILKFIYLLIFITFYTMNAFSGRVSDKLGKNEKFSVTIDITEYINKKRVGNKIYKNEKINELLSKSNILNSKTESCKLSMRKGKGRRESKKFYLDCETDHIETKANFLLCSMGENLTVQNFFFINKVSKKDYLIGGTCEFIKK